MTKSSLAVGQNQRIDEVPVTRESGGTSMTGRRVKGVLTMVAQEAWTILDHLSRNSMAAAGSMTTNFAPMACSPGIRSSTHTRPP